MVTGDYAYSREGLWLLNLRWLPDTVRKLLLNDICKVAVRLLVYSN